MTIHGARVERPPAAARAATPSVANNRPLCAGAINHTPVLQKAGASYDRSLVDARRGMLILTTARCSSLAARQQRRIGK